MPPGFLFFCLDFLLVFKILNGLTKAIYVHKQLKGSWNFGAGGRVDMWATKIPKPPLAPLAPLLEMSWLAVFLQLFAEITCLPIWQMCNFPWHARCPANSTQPSGNFRLFTFIFFQRSEIVGSYICISNILYPAKFFACWLKMSGAR